MSQQDALMRDDDIDVIGIFAQLRKYWWLLFGIPLVVGALLLVGLSFATPKYVSTARVLIQERSAPFTGTTEDSNRITQLGPSEETVRSQVEVIKSNNLTLNVIDNLSLTRHSEFQKGSLLNKLSALLGGTTAVSARNRALKIFNDNLDVYAVDGTTVIVIEYASPLPERAQEIVTKLLDEYNLYRDSLNKNAAVWLDPKIKELEVELKTAEAKVAQERAKNDVLLSDNNNALLATQQLSEVSTELSRLKAERSSAQARAASVRSALQNGSSIDVIPEVIDSPLIQRLREREVELRAQISDLSTTLLPNHPRLRALNSQVEDFQRQIRSAAQNILASLENNVNTTREAEADLEKEIVGLKAEAARVADALVELRPFEQDAETKRTLLADYRSRFQEAKSREGLNAVEVGVIAAASLPIDPAFPKPIPYTIAGVVAAFLLTGVCLVTAAMLSAAVRPHTNAGNAQDANQAENQDTNTAKSEPDLSAVTPETQAGDEKSKIAAKLNKVQKEMKKRLSGEDDDAQEHIMFDADDDFEDEFEDELPHVAAPQLDMSKSGVPIQEVQEEFDDSVLAVRYAANVIADLDQARVMVASPSGDAGSYTAWMLVRAIAKSGKSSLIVDLSGGGVTSVEMLGSKDLHGLYALMAGAVAFNSVVYKDRSSNAHVVPAGIMLPNTPQLNLQSMAEVISAISASYDFVVIDCGDADVRTMSSIAAENSIFVISGIGAKPAQCNELEKDLVAQGYSDILQIIPDSVDHDKDKVLFA